MKRIAGWATVAGLFWLLAGTAFAQGMQRSPPGRGEGGGPQRMMPAEQRDQASGAREQPSPDSAGRLSAEERRQLRRDVHEAGRDLYPVRGPRGRREPRQP